MSLKDRVTERATQWMINREFKSLGRMTTLSIDSKSSTINLKLDLKGEPTPVEITVRDYTVVEENGRVFLEFTTVDVSREWINALLQQCFPRPRVEITKWSTLIKLLL